ncbi:hypothetical protein, partial [uncultured Thiodictyon sp.]|uniref:hypothetical protein n=1 Tax=uncultured Thiodictyon sp. TaxID=1846217 RepID=UPI0025DAE5BC
RCRCRNRNRRSDATWGATITSITTTTTTTMLRTALVDPTAFFSWRSSADQSIMEQQPEPSWQTPAPP